MEGKEVDTIKSDREYHIQLEMSISLDSLLQSERFQVMSKLQCTVSKQEKYLGVKSEKPAC